MTPQKVRGGVGILKSGQYDVHAVRRKISVGNPRTVQDLRKAGYP